MNKRIEEHIKNKDYVRVYIEETAGLELTHFNGFILEQNDDLVMMIDTIDFYYDGIVFARKSDITEIRCREIQKFNKFIYEKENLIDDFFSRHLKLNLNFGTVKELFESIKENGIPVNIYCEYEKESRFVIGPVADFDAETIWVKHFDAIGEYDLKPVKLEYDEITYIKVNSPYSNIYYKYASEVN